MEEDLEGTEAVCCFGGHSALIRSEDEDVFMTASVGFTVVLDDFAIIFPATVHTNRHTYIHTYSIRSEDEDRPLAYISTLPRGELCMYNSPQTLYTTTHCKQSYVLRYIRM